MFLIQFLIILSGAIVVSSIIYYSRTPPKTPQQLSYDNIQTLIDDYDLTAESLLSIYQAIAEHVVNHNVTIHEGLCELFRNYFSYHNLYMHNYIFERLLRGCLAEERTKNVYFFHTRDERIEFLTKFFKNPPDYVVSLLHNIMVHNGVAPQDSVVRFFPELKPGHTMQLSSQYKYQ